MTISGLNLVKLENVIAPMPYLRPDVAEKYKQLRTEVIVKAGIDFMARCGDIYRTPNFKSSKDGVANRSWHKCGVAFDYDQESKYLVVAPDIIGGKQYFKTYLKCAVQDGSLGTKMTVKMMNGTFITAYLFDFTKAAEAVGFRRIPAWSDWQSKWNRREFWHYQFDEGKSWDEAMLELKGKTRPVSRQVLGLNDRGEDVRALQTKLAELNLLSKAEIDGVFGGRTKAAVHTFQFQNGLDADGIAGPNTTAKLFK